MSTNNTLSTRSTQPEKARLGAVGENMVVSMLMQNGWDAFNANCTIKNTTVHENPLTFQKVTN